MAAIPVGAPVVPQSAAAGWLISVAVLPSSRNARARSTGLDKIQLVLERPAAGQ